jgi:hypothetical protein
MQRVGYAAPNSLYPVNPTGCFTNLAPGPGIRLVLLPK